MSAADAIRAREAAKHPKPVVVAKPIKAKPRKPEPVVEPPVDEIGEAEFSGEVDDE